MESELGRTLFERSYKGLEPTAQGEIFASFARETLQRFEEMRMDFSTTKQRPSILLTEILFHLLFLERHLFSIEKYDIFVKKLDKIRQRKHQVTTYIASYERIANPDYFLEQEVSFPAVYMAGKDSHGKSLPLLLNSDIHCPLRQLSLTDEKERKIHRGRFDGEYSSTSRKS